MFHTLKVPQLRSSFYNLNLLGHVLKSHSNYRPNVKYFFVGFVMFVFDFIKSTDTMYFHPPLNE